MSRSCRHHPLSHFCDMKILIPIMLLTLVLGCATGGSKRMDADKLASIKPGETTKDQMFQWFGTPVSQSLDTSGKLAMNWHHVRAQSYGFYTDVKSQMLAAVFDANGVVQTFSVLDDVSKKAESTNAPTAGKRQ